LCGDSKVFAWGCVKNRGEGSCSREGQKSTPRRDYFLASKRQVPANEGGGGRRKNANDGNLSRVVGCTVRALQGGSEIVKRIRKKVELDSSWPLESKVHSGPNEAGEYGVSRWKSLQERF